MRRILGVLALTCFVTACGGSELEPEPQVTFQLRGLFDSTRATLGPTDPTTVSDSLRGTLTVDHLSLAPRGNLFIEKCTVTCYGATQAVSFAASLTAGFRLGDSVVMYMFFDGATRLELRGLHQGDSITGEMITWRQTETVNRRYYGRFIARE